MSNANGSQQQSQPQTVAALTAAVVAVFTAAQSVLILKFAALIARYGNSDLLLFQLRKASKIVVAGIRQQIPGMVSELVNNAAAEGAQAGGNIPGEPAAPRFATADDSFESHAERSARAIREDLEGKLNGLDYRITRFADDVYRAVVADAAQDQVLGRLTPAQAQHDAYVKLMRKGIDGFVDSKGRNWELTAYVDMAVRTAAERSYNVSNLDRMQARGINYFVVSDDGHPCPLCVVSGTIVSGPAPVGAVRTEYSGNLITIRTALGNELTATPDHTVLTPNGWRRMKDLAPGDKVIHDGGQETLASFTMPDHVQVPTRIEDVVKPGLPLLLARPSGGELDVNIAYREVEVVDPSSVLLSERDLALGEPFGDLLLVPRIGECLSCLRERNLALGLDGAGNASTGIMRGLDDRGTLGLGVSGPLPLVTLGTDREKLVGIHGLNCGPEAIPSGTPRNVGALEVTISALMADSEGGTELARAFASKVSADEIIGLEIIEFSGHVWDIQTDQNWYSSNGIISHNCAPWQGEILTAGVPDDIAQHTIAEATAAGLWHPRCRHILTAFVPGFTVVPPPHKWNAEDQRRYDESQRQRALERAIRAARRELDGAFTLEMKAAANRHLRAAQKNMRDFIDQTGRVRIPRREQLHL